MSGSRSELEAVLIPKAWRDAIRQVVALVQRYGSLPRAIVGIVAIWIVNGFLNLGAYVVNSILLLSDAVTSSLAFAGLELGIGFGAAGQAILNAVWGVQLQIIGSLNPYGPLTPVVTIGVLAVELLLIWRLLVAILGELPIGSSIVDLLGLR